MQDHPERDYERVAGLIAYLRAQQPRQPGLSELARQAGLSESHLQRLFTRWAGVSPKRFLQHLALERARPVLAAGGTVLEAAHAAGLSGGSRLHDLLIHGEAVTPGEVNEPNLEIRHGFCPTPFGEALLATTPRGLCFLAFRDPDDRPAMLADLRARWPHARLLEDPNRAETWATRLFQQPSCGQPLALHLRGTNFQLQVWRALLAIPEGSTTTYGQIAHSLGRPGAGRAVGGAVGCNPVSWLIPCHRVLRSDGRTGGYRWGVQRKEIMLAREAARISGQAAGPIPYTVS